MKYPALDTLIIRRWVTALALIMLAFIMFDYLQAGIVNVKRAKFHNRYSVEPLTINLPYQLSITRHYYAYKGAPVKDARYDTYTFIMPTNWLNRLLPLKLVPNGCTEYLDIDGVSIYRNTGACRNSPILLPRWVQDDDVMQRVTIGVNSATSHMAPHLERLPFLNYTQRILGLFAAVYMLAYALSRAANMRGFHRSALLCVGFALSFVSLTDKQEWSLQAVVFLFGIIALVLAGGCMGAVRRLYVWIDGVLAAIMRAPPSRGMWICVAAFFVLTGVLSQLLFDGLPHIVDTHSQYIQSKIFASGQLFERSHPYREFFYLQNVINNGSKYYSCTFPGHPLLLAAGQLVGLPWLVNPLLGALTVGVVFLLAREIAGMAAAYVAAVLVLLSPMIVYMSSEYMNHVSCMLFLTLAVYAYIRMYKTGSTQYAALAGLCMGCALTIRVQAAIPFGLPLALHALWRMARHPVKYAGLSVCMGAAFSVPVSLLLYYQYRTTGDPFLSAYILAAPSYNEPKILSLLRQGWPYVVQELMNTQQQVILMQKELFGWPTLSLWWVFLMYLFRLQTPYVKWAAWPVIGQFVGFFFIFKDHGGPFLNNRYVYEASGLLVVLTAVAITQIARRCSAMSWSPVAVHGRSMLVVVVAVLALGAIPNRWMPLYTLYSQNYWEGNWGKYEMFQQTLEKPALVFMSIYDEYRMMSFTHPPHDDDPIIFALDSPSRKRKPLMDYYPDRHVYTYEYNQLEKIR